VNFSREELKKLSGPALLCLALLIAGSALIWSSGKSLRLANAQLSAVQADRMKNGERLARIADEEREVKEKLKVYQHLKDLNILGEEKRLEWADAMTRIRTQRELLDVRYRVERQRLLTSLPGKPARVDFYASSMKVDLALLHENDLLRFLEDLRNSGNAYYSVKRCAISRTGQAASSANMAPRLRAECDIDLITVVDRGAKQ
jgi:hypothetical protein